MKIAIDFDGTYDRDPELWRRFIETAVHFGHEVICVTMRRDRPGERIAISMSIPVYYTERMAKRARMKELGIRVDVWIDDKPHFVDEDHPLKELDG